MKIEIPTTKTVDIKFVRVVLPIRHGSEAMPEDFPLRQGDVWQATIDLETGIIENWPQGKTGEFYMKVTDMGSYYLMDADRNDVLSIEQDYVPHGVIPGKYGDYVQMEIDESGRITNFPTRLEFSDFLDREED
jgi:hypothetical protein